MKTQKISLQKRTYYNPIIEQIKLDSEISLALESTPPVYELTKSSTAPDYFNNDPLKI